MQLVIDINAETPAALRLAAAFLQDHALLREQAEAGMTPPAPPVPDFATMGVPAAPPPPPPVDNVFPLPAPSAPQHATAPASATNVAPAAASALPAPPIAPPASVSQADEFDKSGMPWDVRIHQKHKNKKKDGTWKLQKGIDKAVVEAVLRELAPRVRANPHTPDTVGASAPVTLPGTSAHPGTTGPSHHPSTAVPPPPPPPPPPPANYAPPPPPATTEENQTPNTAPGAEGASVDPFRALVSKITTARRENKISPEEITQALAGAGAPSLQLLNNMPHLIPTVEASIDAILAVR